MKKLAASGKLRFSVILISAFLCLAFVMQAATPAPARADDQCSNRAWIDLPTDDILTFLPKNYDWNSASTVAMGKHHAVIVWPYEAVGGLYGYRAMVGKVSTDSEGAFVWFNANKVYTVRTLSGVSRPAVAINDQDQVIIAFEAPTENVSYEACNVTGSGSSLTLTCGAYYEEIAQGQTPSVALNNNGWAVLTYEGNVFQELWYRTGIYWLGDSEVLWDDGHHYDHGVNPYVAMSGDRVVEVHHNGVGFYNHLYYHVGQLDEVRSELHWGKSHRYETDGWSPTVAVYGSVVVELHQGSHERIYYRYGTIEDNKTINWQDGSGRHRWGSGDDGDTSSCVAAADGRLLMSFANFDTSPYTMVYGGIGRVGHGTTCPWPTVRTLPVSHLSPTGAVSGGDVTIPGFSSVTARGVCWSTTKDPTINNSKTTDGKGLGSYASHIKKLSPNTGYYVRAYATNSHGTGYGESRYFHTGQLMPKAITFYPFFKTSEGALTAGAVVSQGGAAVTDRGLCWSKEANPTIEGDCQSAGSGLGGFNEMIMGLSSDTTYHLRAYGTNEYGTGYGANQVFKTLHPSLATVYTADPLDITASSATLGGDVTKSGSDLVTERGVVWDTSPMPNLSNQRAAIGSGQGVFAQNIAGFTPETTYYVRAYAVNGAGPSYGQDKLFTASDDVTPRVVTTAPYGETDDSALSGGYVTNPGKSPVIARGVCWSASPSPTVSDAHSTDGSGMGQFHSVISGLSPEVGYYVRAYATNSAGTSYGEEYFFHSTHPSYPTVHTLAAIDISASSAVVSGEVILEGDATADTRGICWSTSPHPKVSDNVVNAGSGAGEFQATIGGLMPEQVYYARAFATNQFGTSYGHIVNFRTTFCPYPCR